MGKRVTIEVKEELAEIFKAIDAENCYSCDTWGTDFDDHNTINDWAAYITQYVGNAIGFTVPLEVAVTAFKKVANLAINAMAAAGRNGSFPGRHYD